MNYKEFENLVNIVADVYSGILYYKHELGIDLYKNDEYSLAHEIMDAYRQFLVEKYGEDKTDKIMTWVYHRGITLKELYNLLNPITNQITIYYKLT